MWDFLKMLLEQHGLSATVLVAVITCAGIAIRTLYLSTVKLTRELADVRVEEGAKRAAMREALNAELAKLTEMHLRDEANLRSTQQVALISLQEEWRKGEQAHQSRLDGLQERRISDSQEFIREATRHVAMTREEIGKISKALEILTDVMTGRR